MLGAVLWRCLEIAANILTRNKFNTLAIKHGQLSRFTASHIICLCYKYPFILHDELNFLSNIKFEILPGENLILGSYLQCNRRTKPDPKLKPIWTQGNYTQGYLRQKASVTATIDKHSRCCLTTFSKSQSASKILHCSLWKCLEVWSNTVFVM